jgi:hypothetical protein
VVALGKADPALAGGRAVRVAGVAQSAVRAPPREPAFRDRAESREPEVVRDAAVTRQPAARVRVPAGELVKRAGLAGRVAASKADRAMRAHSADPEAPVASTQEDLPRRLHLHRLAAVPR